MPPHGPPGCFHVCGSAGLAVGVVAGLDIQNIRVTVMYAYRVSRWLPRSKANCLPMQETQRDMGLIPSGREDP